MNDSPVCAAQVSLLSIEAWRDGPSWVWNSWRRLDYVPAAYAELTPRALLKVLRDRGTLARASAGKLAVEDDGYNVVIVARGTREPLYAIAYGEAE
jgi:hypothetical protein